MGCVVVMGVCAGASWRATGGDSLKVANGVYLELGHVVGALSPMLFNKPFCFGTKTHASQGDRAGGDLTLSRLGVGVSIDNSRSLPMIPDRGQSKPNPRLKEFLSAGFQLVQKSIFGRCQARP